MRLQDLTPEVRAFVIEHKLSVECPKCGRLTSEPTTERIRRKDGSIIEQTVWVHWLPEDRTEKWEIKNGMLSGSSSETLAHLDKRRYQPCITDVRVIQEPRKPCPKCRRLGREYRDKRGFRYFQHGRGQSCYIGKP
jgi:predicted RNA-binding Zn-ribbon protein involved in translation (DUF1610 family)